MLMQQCDVVISSDTLLQTADSDKFLLLAAKEATFAYHTAIYGQSFKSSDRKFWTSFKNFWT